MLQFDWNKLTITEYNDLRQAVGWKSVPEEQAQMGLKQSTVLSVSENQSVIGMARSISDGMQSLIVDVAVLPEYQGQGIGTLMMKELLQYEKATTSSLGEKYVNIMAFAGKDPFYAKLGFLARPNVLQGAGMSLKLDPNKPYKFENIV